MAAALLTFHIGAHAGAGKFSVVVSPLQNPVTISPAQGAVTYMGFTASVTNMGRNTINDIHFIGRISRSGDDQPIIEGATCQTTTAVVETMPVWSIDCSLGQLSSGASYPTFSVFFRAPPSLGDPAEAVFSGEVRYAEGTGGVPSSIPQNSIYPWPSVTITLEDVDKFGVSSAIPKSGGHFFTGTGVTLTGDVFTTAVTVPASASDATVTIDEVIFKKGCSNFKDCYESILSIPNQIYASNVLIRLRQDVTNIKPGTRIESVKIFYLSDDPGAAPYEVLDCPSVPQPRDGKPCIVERVHYQDPAFPDDFGDYGWLVANDRNGSYKFP
jgi:hypothetical protein